MLPLVFAGVAIIGRILLVITLIGCHKVANCLAITQEESDTGESTELIQRLGYEPFSIQGPDGNIQYFVSTNGKKLDSSRKLGIVLFLQGSGPTPLYFGEKDHLRSSLIFDSNDFPNHHFVVISKPGIPFYAADQSLPSQEYQERLSLDGRIQDASQVINHIATEDWTDPSEIVVVGHSEGADVAPWLATQCQQISHLVTLSPGGLSQMLELILLERNKVARGIITPSEGEAEIRNIRSAFQDIFKDPGNWKKQWYGHSYLRWSTFMRPSMDAYVQLEIPILAIAGADDRNTPCESGEAIDLEFIRLGKHNLTFEVWPVDHHFIQRTAGENKDCRQDLIHQIHSWLQASTSPVR